MGTLGTRRAVLLASSLVAGIMVIIAGPALADHADEPGSNTSDCSFASEGGNTAVPADGVAVYAGPNSSGPDPEGSNRLAAGVCLDDNDHYEGTNEVAADADTLYFHMASDGGEGNNEALFDGWFGVWSCGGGESPELRDGIHGNWHDDEAAPCQGSGTTGSAADDAPANECPAAETDPSDGNASVQTPAGAACWELADLSCAHVWADVNDSDAAPLGPFASAGNDHPGNEEGCGDPSDEPDDNRSAHNGFCAGVESGPDSGTNEPLCANPGDTIDEYGISLGSELDECQRFVLGEESNPDHTQPGVCADDDGDGIPDPGS